jgi:SAM-dependent methyltransferase
VTGGNPLYDDPELAASYARVSASNVCNAAYERPAVRAILGDVHGLDVLDAGAAAGEHSAWLLANGARVVALDASEAMVRLARERLGGTAQVLRADLSLPLPLPNRAFDLVVSSLTLHYVADWLPPLREFRRVLRPRGRLVLSTHHPSATLEPGDDYFALRRVDDAFGDYAAEKVPVRYYHRPLEKIVDDVVAAGFALHALREPRPAPEGQRRDPALAAKLASRPWFLIVDAEAGPP